MRNLAVLVVLLSGVMGCSSSNSDSTVACVEALEGCDEAVCEGNYVKRCSQDGIRYEYEACYPRTCVSGVCQTAACDFPGQSRCDDDDPSLVETCSDAMTQWSTRSCAQDTHCANGVCVPDSCNAGEKRCGMDSVLECDTEGSAWTATDCEANQYCSDVQLACLEREAFCMDNPLGAQCLDLVRRASCSPSGILEPEDCRDGEVCVDGFCQAQVCGAAYVLPEDVVEDQTDTTEPADVTGEASEVEEEDVIEWDLPPLTLPAKGWATLDGGPFENQKVEFTSAKTANYVVNDLDLQISMGMGVFFLEVHIVGVEEKMVGHYTSEDAETVQCMVLFNDGTQDPSVVQWKYASEVYDITLSTFEDVGGRVIGSFSGTLREQVAEGEPASEVVVTVTDGYFDVPRKQ